ncbi:hypothetical protein JMJ35_007901 [Cladonia borealis]|uniref:Uncharacterized protein n=1 Tax=Cladonia borealis TaxID=184061 RepID=A0AA39QUK3_9LECA|nr:hypothetical protein JMJ35_007901 [Cladonia borealis]
MAAQPTPPHTPTTTTTPTPAPSPPLTASQARALLQTLLSTHPNPRPTPTTTTSNNASKPSPSSPPSNNQPPSSFPTITIDASTRIMGHANKIRLSAHNVHEAARVEGITRAALSHTKPTGYYAAGPVNITIRTGMVLMGSRNVVVFGEGGFDEEDAAVKDSVKARGEGEMVGKDRVCEEGRKRRAESEPVVETRGGKKVKVEKGV